MEEVPEREEGEAMVVRRCEGDVEGNGTVEVIGGGEVASTSSGSLMRKARAVWKVTRDHLRAASSQLLFSTFVWRATYSSSGASSSLRRNVLT